MLSELSLIIIREIILRFNEYQSILKFKLTNKRLFKFIEYDIVVQRYYLKLKYNLIINDEDLFKYIKLLDSKFYSKCLTYFESFKRKNMIFVNPCNDHFIVFMERSKNSFSLVISKDNAIIYKITNSILENNIETLKETLFAEGYLLLDIEYSVEVGSEICSQNGNLFRNIFMKLYIR